MKRPLYIVVATLVLWSGACDSGVDSERIVIAEATDIGVLLPALETSALDGEINSQLYLSLNSARWENGRLEYAIDDLSLAERWEFSGDSTVLLYFLRDDAVWSDGHPIDADDVVFTFELIRNPEVGSVYIDAWENLDSVVVVSRHEVAFHFKRRYPGMLFDTGIGIVPQHVFQDAAVDHATLAGHPALIDPADNLVVSGPYRVAEWVQGDRLVLVANPQAFTREPATDTVVFRVLPEPLTRLIEVENGSADVTGPLAMDEIERLAARPNLRIETVADRFYDYIAWNGSAFEPFGDADVRLALSLAIDRSEILAGLGIDPYARPAGGPYPPIFGDVVDPTVTPDPYLPDSAGTILTAQGWSDSDGDGVLDRDGHSFRFTLLTQAGNQRRESAAEIIQARYADIGIDMQIRLVDFNSLLGLMFEERDFEAVLMGWQVALEPDYLVGFFWPPDHPFNITGYANPKLDEIIPLAQAAATAGLAAPHWRAAAKVISLDRPYAFLWYFDDAVAVNQRIQNTRIDTYGLYQNLYQWRVRN